MPSTVSGTWRKGCWWMGKMKSGTAGGRGLSLGWDARDSQPELGTQLHTSCPFHNMHPTTLRLRHDGSSVGTKEAGGRFN